jgi:hypothetical protein
MLSTRFQQLKSRCDASRLGLLKPRDRKASDRALWNQSNVCGNDHKVSCCKRDQHNILIAVLVPCVTCRSLLKGQLSVISMEPEQEFCCLIDLRRTSAVRSISSPGSAMWKEDRLKILATVTRMLSIVFTSLVDCKDILSAIQAIELSRLVL